MKTLSVVIGGKTYPLKVDEADERMMLEISKMVDERLKNFKTALSNQPEATALVMTSLSIAEELFMARRDHHSSSQSGDVSGFAVAVKADLEKIVNSIR